MKKILLIPTLLVAIAVTFLIGLGVWQLERKAEKEALLATYAEAANKPEISFPATPNAQDAQTYLFRHATGYCALVTGWSAEAGGAGSWKHVATCFTGDSAAQPMQVDVGSSPATQNPQWPGGTVSGVIAADPVHVLRLVAAQPADGLQASPPPAADNVAVTPFGHLCYALTWFAFAIIAVVIYVLALRRRPS